MNNSKNTTKKRKLTHLEVINGNLAIKVSEITGIKIEMLNKCGIKFAFEHPKAVEGITATQVKKIEVLKSFISLFNETEFLKETILLNSTSKSGEYFVKRLSNISEKEVFEVAFLNSQNEIIATKTVFEGSINETAIYPRIVVKLALEHDANSVILAHNHPWLSLKESSDDITVTRSLKQALEAISIKVVDHIIVAGNRYTSFREQGLL